MNNISSLVAQQPSAQQPQQEGSAGGADMASLSSLVQRAPGAPAGGGPAAQPPAPDHAQTVAAITHLGEFQRRFRALQAIPDIGKASIRGEVIDMMADVMGDGLVTLPQVMSQLKTFPSDPLAQKQWVDKHYQNTAQALQTILAQHAQAFPRTGLEPVPPMTGKGGVAQNHATMMGALVDHYKSRTRH